VLSSTVYATDASLPNIDDVRPMEGEEIDTGEGFQNIVPISGDMPIDLIGEDDWGRNPLARDIEPHSDELDVVENQNNIWLFAGVGAGRVVLLIIMICIVKKSKE
jgi:hypothetical protein